MLVGFNVDVARAICLELDTACDIKVRPWGELLPALQRGEADAVIAAHAVTPQALASVDFTDRYFYTPGRFAGKLGGERDRDDAGRARRKAHRRRQEHRARGLPQGLLPLERHQVLRERRPRPRRAIQGEVDYVFDDGISLIFWLHGTASKRCCEMKGGPYLEPKYFGDGIAIAVPKNDQQIKTLINGALARLRANGRLDELVERYFPVKVY